MLDELAREISREYHIRPETIKDFLSTETEEALSKLKKEFSNKENSEGKLSKEKIDELFNVIKGGKEILKQSVKSEIDALKNKILTIDNLDSQELEDYLSGKILPKKLLARIQNPTNLSDQITGLSV